LNIHPPSKEYPAVVIEAAESKNLLKLDKDELRQLFITHGAILFRGYMLDLDKFEAFTDQFCNAYVSNESPGREVLSKDGRVQTVNLGYQHFPLHPEISREPWQPDIAWFACEQASLVQGETTFCDGVAAANSFSAELLEHLKTTTLAHKIPTTLQWCAQFLGEPNLLASTISQYSDPTGFQFSEEGGELFRTYLRPMLHKTMFTDQWAYGNFLVFARRRLSVRNFPCYVDGTEVPDDIVDEIERVTNSLSAEVKWQKNDLLMLDNTRFMHGRNPIGDPQSRRIYTQFGYASFAPKQFQDLKLFPWRKPR